jgi:hypothetical protein
MQTYSEILNRPEPLNEIALRDLETLVGGQIALKSGAERATIAGAPELAVQRVPLGLASSRQGLECAVEWLARRIRAGGSGVFSVAIRKQTDNLVLVAEWPREGAVVETAASASVGVPRAAAYARSR